MLHVLLHTILLKIMIWGCDSSTAIPRLEITVHRNNIDEHYSGVSEWTLENMKKGARIVEAKESDFALVFASIPDPSRQNEALNDIIRPVKAKHVFVVVIPPSTLKFSKESVYQLDKNYRESTAVVKKLVDDMKATFIQQKKELNLQLL